MKKTLFLFLMLHMLICTHAASDKSLYVVLSDGSTIEFALKETPELSFINRSLKIEDNNNYSVFLIDMVKEFYFMECHVGIEQVLQDNDLKVVSQNENAISIEGLKSNERINVYTIDGKLMPVDVFYGSNQATLRLEKLPKGTYIIKIGNRQTFKINRK